MSDAQNLKNQIIEKAWADAAFKQQLLADPAAAIKDTFNLTVPAGIEVAVVEETSSKLYLVIPQNPADASDDDNLEYPMWV